MKSLNRLALLLPLLAAFPPMPPTTPAKCKPWS